MTDKFLREENAYVLMYELFYPVPWLYSPAACCSQEEICSESVATLPNWKLGYPMNCYPRNVNELCARCILVWSSHTLSTNFCRRHFSVSQVYRGFPVILHIMRYSILWSGLAILFSVSNSGLRCLLQLNSVGEDSWRRGKKMKFKHYSFVLSEDNLTFHLLVASWSHSVQHKPTTDCLGSKPLFNYERNREIAPAHQYAVFESPLPP